MDDLDQIFMADQKEAMGLGTRFTLIEPQEAVQEPDKGMFVMADTGVDMGKVAEMVFVEPFKRMVDAVVYSGESLGAAIPGLPGDVTGIIKGLYNMASDEEKSAMEAFTEGFESQEMLPTTEDVKSWFRENIYEHKPVSQAFQDIPEAEKAFGLAGEMIAPPVYVKAGKAAYKAASKLKPKKIQGLNMTPEALAQYAMAMKNDISSAGVLKKYVESFAGRRNVKKGQLCHDQACRFVMEQGSEPGDKLLMLKTGQKDLVAHSIVVDKAGNLKYDNFGGQWDNKAKSYTAPEVDGAGKPIPQDFRNFTSYEEVDIDLLKKAAEKYKGAK